MLRRRSLGTQTYPVSDKRALLSSFTFSLTLPSPSAHARHLLHERFHPRKKLRYSKGLRDHLVDSSLQCTRNLLIACISSNCDDWNATKNLSCILELADPSGASQSIPISKIRQCSLGICRMYTHIVGISTSMRTMDSGVYPR